MFSGIVEGKARIEQLQDWDDCTRLTLTAEPHLVDGVTKNDSIAINGVCLTITQVDNSNLTVDIVPETRQKTTLDNLQLNDEVNFERAMRYGDRVGGHLVQGHIDTTTVIEAIETTGQAQYITFKLPPTLNPYIIPKGYIAIDGMSLTVVDKNAKQFWITLIPHTQSLTIGQHYQVGTQVNIEVDMMAKYAISMNYQGDDNNA